MRRSAALAAASARLRPAARATAALLAVLAVAACGSSGGERAASDAASGAAPDPTRAAAGGTGLPAGRQARTDAGTADLTGVRYDVGGDGRWEVTTGPAHVVWAPGDTASGRYTARAAFEQLEAPAHPEAFGLIVGGGDLAGAAPRYTYFVVRGTGEYLVRVREGGSTRDVQPWTAAPALARQDGQGRARYDLAVRVDADSVRFLAGDRAVHAVAAGTVPTDGVVGLRVNHNLHLRTGAPTITR